MRAEAVTSTCKDDLLAPCRFNFTKPYFSHSFHNCCNKSYQRSTLLAKQIGSEDVSFFTCMTLSSEKLTFFTFLTYFLSFFLSLAAVHVIFDQTFLAKTLRCLTVKKTAFYNFRVAICSMIYDPAVAPGYKNVVDEKPF